MRGSRIGSPLRGEPQVCAGSRKGRADGLAPLAAPHPSPLPVALGALAARVPLWMARGRRGEGVPAADRLPRPPTPSKAAERAPVSSSRVGAAGERLTPLRSGIRKTWHFRHESQTRGRGLGLLARDRPFDVLQAEPVAARRRCAGAASAKDGESERRRRPRFRRGRASPAGVRQWMPWTASPAFLYLPTFGPNLWPPGSRRPTSRAGPRRVRRRRACARPRSCRRSADTTTAGDVRGFQLHSIETHYGRSQSQLEDLRVAPLDLLRALLHALRILLHQPYIGQFTDARLVDVWRWAEYWLAPSTISCCASRECIQFWNRRAAFGLGAALNTALGPVASGVPSSG